MTHPHAAVSVAFGLAHAMDDLFAPRPAVERPYIQTTPMTAPGLRAARSTAAEQDEAVLGILRASGSAMAPSAVHAAGVRDGRAWLLTSVRRSMTNLTKAGALVKAGGVDGPHGRPEHTWGLA